MTMSYWPLYSRRDKEKRTETAIKIRKASLWLLAGKTVIYFLRDEVSKWGGIKFLPTGWNLNTFNSL